MKFKAWPLLTVASIITILISFQNCGPGFRSGEISNLSSQSDPDQLQLQSSMTVAVSSNANSVPAPVSINYLPDQIYQPAESAKIMSENRLVLTPGYTYDPRLEFKASWQQIEGPSTLIISKGESANRITGLVASNMTYGTYLLRLTVLDSLNRVVTKDVKVTFLKEVQAAGGGSGGTVASPTPSTPSPSTVTCPAVNLTTWSNCTGTSLPAKKPPGYTEVHFNQRSGYTGQTTVACGANGAWVYSKQTCTANGTAASNPAPAPTPVPTPKPTPVPTATPGQTPNVPFVYLPDEVYSREDSASIVGSNKHVLTPSGSYAVGLQFTTSWQQLGGPTVTVIKGTSVNQYTSLVYSNIAYGTYTFRYTVLDQFNRTVTKDVNVTFQK